MTSESDIASHAGVLKGARISSLPTNCTVSRDIERPVFPQIYFHKIVHIE